MSDETREPEVQVPEGFIVLHPWDKVPRKMVRPEAIDSYYADCADPDWGTYVQTRSDGTWRVQESPAALAALITEAQGGGEAEEVVKWLEGAAGSEARQVWVAEETTHFAAIFGRQGNPGWAQGNGTTFLAAIAAAEAERS